MQGRIMFVAGAAVGYVLGSRAGRRRYEQIKSVADTVWHAPIVQRGVGEAESFVRAKVGELPGVLFDGARFVVVRVVGGKPRSDDQTEA